MVTACPKCAYAPPPPQRAFPAACPACGLVLAKYQEAMERAIERKQDQARGRAALEEGGGDSIAARVQDLLFHVPHEVSRFNWQGRLAALALVSLWSIWIFKDYSITQGHPGSYFLHSVLLPFHEAGHYAIFRWFGEFIMILGGTLGQHLMPLVLAGALLIQRRDPFGAALFFWLLGFSMADMGIYMFLGFSMADMGIYMYDAFDPKLALLDGGTGAESDGHDWQNIFGDLGLLQRAHAIGRFSAWIGALMMLAGLAWAAWMVWLQSLNLSDAAGAEMNPDD